MILGQLDLGFPLATLIAQWLGYTDSSVVTTIAQLLTIIATTIVLVLFSILCYVVIKKQDPTKKPSKFTTFLIGYVTGFENLMNSITGGKLKMAFPYFFTIFNFILINTLLSIIGFVPAPTTLTFTLTLAMITFIGIYVVGIGTNGLLHFIKHKYANPIEILGQIAPLLSLSLRLFGATLATFVIGEIVIIILEGIGQTGIATWYPLVSIPWSWLWTLADSALGIIQAFVFTVLTALYWSLEAGPSWKRSERKKHYESEKKLNKQIKEENKQT